MWEIWTTASGLAVNEHRSRHALSINQVDGSPFFAARAFSRRALYRAISAGSGSGE